MYKRISTLTFLILFTMSLFAMDLNETKSIINEATKATEILQNKFDVLINEKLIEQNSTLEHNSTLELNSTVPLNELNSSRTINCKKNTETLTLDTPTNSNEENNDTQDTNTEMQGKSIRGLIIFKTRIKPLCNINGEAFAKQYMQEDWDDIYHDKEFKLEVLKACPKVEKKYKDAWTPHLYQFTIEYASDSDAIPEC